MNFNKAIVAGNITRDPELTVSPSGISVCRFCVATNYKHTDKNGIKKEEVEYHNIVLFDKQADNVNTHIQKGSEVLVEGRIKTSNWEDDGVKKYNTQIIGTSVHFGKLVPEHKPETDSPYNNDDFGPSF